MGGSGEMAGNVFSLALSLIYRLEMEMCMLYVSAM